MASRRMLAVPLVVTAVALGACGGSAAQVATAPSATTGTAATTAKQPAQAPQVVTARHHGRTLRLARGRDVELRLAPRAEIDVVRGRSVSLSPIDFFADPGYTAWMLTARSAGTTVLAGRSGGKPFRVTLVVPG
jgi:hypothetical protein